MNRRDFQRLSRERQRDARALLAAKRYQAAFYVAGYAVECALKARISRATCRHDFPDKNRVNQAHTHDLETLLRLADLWDPDGKRPKGASAAVVVSWGLVANWDEKVRYGAAVDAKFAKEYLDACFSRRSGFVTWIRSVW
jgi:hypothetical protein